MGWVESSRGVPIAGAVVSIFGKGIRGGNLVTLSDSRGQFVLPSLPPGSYTLRAVGTGHEPSAAQHVTVLPNRDSLYTLSLTPVGEKPQAAAQESAEAKSLREWLWLMRHKQRSVLETEAADAAATAPEEGPNPPTLNTPTASKLPSLPTVGPVDGTVELVATSDTGALSPASLAAPGGVGALRLSGRLADGITLEPRRPRGRERGTRVAHGRGVRAAAGRLPRDQGRARATERATRPRSSPTASRSPTARLARSSPRTRGT